jgi:high-affinity nickel-transport protein
MLILLGVLSLSGLLQRATVGLSPEQTAAMHAHPHQHEDYVHDHPHGHEPGAHGHEATPLSRLDRWFGGLGPYQIVRPIVIGVVHGLAGSAAVALLVLATIRDPLWAIGYLLLFGVEGVQPFAPPPRQTLDLDPGKLGLRFDLTVGMTRNVSSKK